VLLLHLLLLQDLNQLHLLLWLHLHHHLHLIPQVHQNLNHQDYLVVEQLLEYYLNLLVQALGYLLPYHHQNLLVHLFLQQD
tara:strand:+ start:162 stop:404 length:243 start_codon:yes stop_codon:yes gene_type:complete